MRLIRILLMVVVVVVLGLVALLVLLPGEKIAKIAADQVRSQTGRELVFEGDVGISWYPILGVKTGPVRFANAEWSDNGPMFRAESAQIGVDAMSLIGGTIRITQIDLNAPDVLLEVQADGTANWDLFPEGAEAGEATTATTEGGGAMGGLVLESLAVRDARLRYLDQGGESFDIKDVDATLVWPDRAGPAEVDLTLRPAEEAVEIAAVIDNLEGFLGGEISTLRANVAAAGASVAFDGRAGMDPQAAGRVEADVPNPNAFMAALGLGEAGIAGKAVFAGNVTYTKDGKIALREGTATALGNTVSVEADVSMDGPRPRVNARIAGGAMTLAALQGGGGGGGDTSSGGGWSKAPIDASGLGIIDGDISLAAESIDLGDMVLGRTRVGIAIDNSRAVVSLRELHMFDGVASGQMVANNRSGLSVSSDITVTGLELKTLLTDMAGIDRMSGVGTMKSQILASGNSVHAIMNSLSGSGSFDIGQGKISGIDLDRLLRGQPGASGTTVFDSLSASWTLTSGVMTNNDLLLDLPHVIAKGAGTIGIGARTINYLFTPQIKNEAEDGLAVPVEIKGSWDNPKIIPRLDKAFGRDIEVDLEEKKDEVREELKSKAKAKLEEKIGTIDTQEGQSTEDAIKQKVEDEVKDKLKSLLGGD
ncbi:AsmA family protein [Shimia aestuarii]|uniref:AsmA family protein n=1 Tax=Shimia aestuarii TaxID=254406 RepID=UPI001FB3C64B|nr:AsmA family protein [Shimia aestuarii]